MSEDSNQNTTTNKLNLNYLKEKLSNCSDIQFVKMSLNNMTINIIFAKSVVDLISLNELIIGNIQKDCYDMKVQDAFNYINTKIPISNIEKVNNSNTAIDEIFNGKVLVLINNIDEGTLINVSKSKYRQIYSPEVESSVLGTKDCFNEDINLNISLIRRRIKHHLCKFQDLTLGRYSQTKVTVCYVENIVNENLLNEIMKRLSLIDIDSIIDISQIAELIEDSPLCAFPTICITERPDKAVSSMLEGRVVLLCENSPFSLIMPYSFIDFFQGSDDYYNGYIFATFIRFIRFTGYFLSIYLPGFYIAITSFHQELLQTKLLISIAKQREGVPFPLPIELLIMILSFELIKEAGIRLPKMFGSAISIVGAIIIGEAVVTAGLVSPLVVIITAVTATSSVITSSVQMNQSILIYRFISIIASSMLGIWGVFIIILFQLGNLVSLKSFGIPYTIPFAPLVKEDLDDILYRAPIWANKKRPHFLSSKNKIRLRK